MPRRPPLDPEGGTRGISPDTTGVLLGESRKKSDEEWASCLSPDIYRITRQKGTEPPFSGVYCHTKTPGAYRCVCCDAPLFSSEAKYDSGSGWPSFWEAVDEGAIATERDSSLWMARVEIMCKACGSHLGHVFDDGPDPTGKRFCVNSASLRLEPSGETPENK